MTQIAIKRIQKELTEIQTTKHNNISENISVGPISPNNLFEWVGTIIGPVGTVYQNGVFNLRIVYPVNYPFQPPNIKFTTTIYHPNIDINGDICLDILKHRWNPAYTIIHVLLSIVSLLSEPNPQDPLNTEAAELMTSDKKKYEKVVKSYVYNFAS